MILFFCSIRDELNFRPPKIFGQKLPKSAFSVFGQNTLSPKQHSRNRNLWWRNQKARPAHAWLDKRQYVCGVDVFQCFWKKPSIVIGKNCNALILITLIKLEHSHSHKCNGTRVVLPIINGIYFESRSNAFFSVNSPLTLGDSVWQRANSQWQRLITFYI